MFLQISIYQAIADRVISHHQGLYRNPATGEGMPIPEAMNNGLIAVERMNRIVEMGELIKSGIIRTTTKREKVTYSVLSIRDPSSYEKMSVAEALRRGVINQDTGRYVINPRSGESISIPAAIDRGFVEVEVVDKKLLEPVTPPTDNRSDKRRPDDELDGFLVTGVYELSLGRHLTLAEAVKNGSVDLQSRVFINSVTGKKYPLAEAIKHGYVSVELASDNSDRENVILRTALCTDRRTGANLEELLEASSRRDGKPLPVDINHSAYEQLRAGVDVHCKRIVDPSSGRTVSIDEAVHSGLLVIDPLGIVSTDGRCVPLNEAAASNMVDTSLLCDMLTGLQQMSLEQMVENGIIDTDSGLYRDPDTGLMVPIADAISAGKLDPYRVFFTDPSSRSVVSLGTAIDNGTYDPASGTFIDALSGEKFSFADAIYERVVCPVVSADETTARVSALKTLGKDMDVSVKGIRDPSTGQDISFSAAVMAGILDISSGKYVDPQTGAKLSLSEAVDAGLISLELAKQLLAAIDENSLAKSNIDLRTGEYVDPQTGQRTSIQEAIDSGHVDPATVFVVDAVSGQFTSLAALMNDDNDIGPCRFDAAAAAFVDRRSGRTLSLADAVSSGFISPGLDVEQLSTNMTVLKVLGDHVDTSLLGILDPRTGEEISLPQAVMAGLIDLSSGELVNLDSGERLAISDAVAAEQISRDMAKQLLSAMNRNSLANSNVDLATGKYVDPQTHECMSVEEAIRLGMIEPSAVFMVDPVTGHPASLAALIDNGCFNPSSGKIRNSTTGVEVSVATAEKNGIAVADFSVDRFIPPEKLSVKDLIDGAEDKVFVTPGGRTMSLREAVCAGLVNDDTTLSVDSKTGSVSVVDQSLAQLVDVFDASKSVTDWLDDVEQRLSTNSRTRLGDAASVRQQIASLQVNRLVCYILQ